MKFKFIDPRHVQIFNNVTLMVYGYYFLNFSRNLNLLIPAFLVSLILDYSLSKYFKFSRDNRSLYDRATSIVNNMASLYVIVSVADPKFYFFGIIFGTLSKFLFRVGDRHIYNPANFGIVVSLLFTDDTTVRIIYSQFASPNTFLFWFIIFNGLLITIWAKRLVLALSFLFCSSIYLYLISPLFNYSSTILIGPNFSVSGLLFTFFMITDPKTTPSTLRGQFLFGAVCSLIGALFRVNEMIHDSFIALFLTTTLYSLVLSRKLTFSPSHAK